MVRPPSGILEFSFNGEWHAEKALAECVAAFNTPALVIAKGGFLLKAAVHQNQLSLGVLPCFFSGERAYHHSIPFNDISPYVLIGGIDATQKFYLLFKATERPLAQTTLYSYRDVYKRLARFLLERGYEGDGLICETTQGALNEMGLFEPPPKSLQELATVNSQRDQIG